MKLTQEEIASLDKETVADILGTRCVFLKEGEDYVSSPDYDILPKPDRDEEDEYEEVNQAFRDGYVVVRLRDY